MAILFYLFRKRVAKSKALSRSSPNCLPKNWRISSFSAKHDLIRLFYDEKLKVSKALKKIFSNLFELGLWLEMAESAHEIRLFWSFARLSALWRIGFGIGFAVVIWIGVFVVGFFGSIWILFRLIILLPDFWMAGVRFVTLFVVVFVCGCGCGCGLTTTGFRTWGFVLWFWLGFVTVFATEACFAVTIFCFESRSVSSFSRRFSSALSLSSRAC